MKILYKENDLWCILVDYIFPYFNESICDIDKNLRFHNMDALRCIDKKLNKMISLRPVLNCKGVTIRGKKMCSKHSKIFPFYKHLKNRYEKHTRITHAYLRFNIHFRRIGLANMFRSQYYDKIHKRNSGKLSTCCSGKGFKLKCIMTG